ncbi:MAG: PG0541 family transporter-associated protein [Candidatus Zipacnadales bacterium]
MKQVIAIFDSGVLPDVMRVLEEQGIRQWTRIGDVKGAGERTIREGSSVWPGLNEILLLVLPPEKVEPFIAGCHAVRDRFPLKPGMKFIVSDCQIY